MNKFCFIENHFSEYEINNLIDSCIEFLNLGKKLKNKIEHEKLTIKLILLLNFICYKNEEVFNISDEELDVLKIFIDEMPFFLGRFHYDIKYVSDCSSISYLLQELKDNKIPKKEIKVTIEKTEKIPKNYEVSDIKNFLIKKYPNANIKWE